MFSLAHYFADRLIRLTYHSNMEQRYPGGSAGMSQFYGVLLCDAKPCDLLREAGSKPVRYKSRRKGCAQSSDFVGCCGFLHCLDGINGLQSLDLFQHISFDRSQPLARRQIVMLGYQGFSLRRQDMSTRSTDEFRRDAVRIAITSGLTKAFFI